MTLSTAARVTPVPVVTTNGRAHRSASCRRALGLDPATLLSQVPDVAPCTYCKPPAHLVDLALSALAPDPAPKVVTATVPDARARRTGLPDVTAADLDAMLALRAGGSSWRAVETAVPHLHRTSSPLRKLVLAEAARRGVTA